MANQANLESDVLDRTFSESAMAFQDYFSRLWMDRGLYDQYWLSCEFLPNERHHRPGQVAAIAEGMIAVTEFPPRVSSFGNALQILNSNLSIQMRIYQIDQELREKINSAEEHGRLEKNRQLEKRATRIASSIFEDKSPENQALQNLFKSIPDAMRYARPVSQATFGLWNRNVCAEKLNQIWFNQINRELIKIALGCMGVANQCLKTAEVYFQEKMKSQQRKIVDSTYPLLGELGLGLIPLSELRGKLLVCLRSAEDLRSLPAFRSCLERALTDFYEPKDLLDVNPLVRVTVDLDAEHCSYVIRFRERPDKLVYTLDVLFTYRNVFNICMSHADEQTTGKTEFHEAPFTNGLILLRELFIIKNIAAFPEIRFGILLMMNLRRTMPKLREHVGRWEMVSWLWAMSEKPFQDVGSVLIRGFSVLELLDIGQNTVRPFRSEDLALLPCLSPFLFTVIEHNTDDVVEETQNSEELDACATKLRQNLIANLLDIQTGSDMQNTYYLGKAVIRQTVLQSLQVQVPTVLRPGNSGPSEKAIPIAMACFPPKARPTSQISVRRTPSPVVTESDRPVLKHEATHVVPPPVTVSDLDPRLSRLQTGILPALPESLPVPTGLRDHAHVQSVLQDRKTLLQIQQSCLQNQPVSAAPRAPLLPTLQRPQPEPVQSPAPDAQPVYQPYLPGEVWNSVATSTWAATAGPHGLAGHRTPKRTSITERISSDDELSSYGRATTEDGEVHLRGDDTRCISPFPCSSRSEDEWTVIKNRQEYEDNLRNSVRQQVEKFGPRSSTSSPRKSLSQATDHGHYRRQSRSPSRERTPDRRRSPSPDRKRKSSYLHDSQSPSAERKRLRSITPEEEERPARRYADSSVRDESRPPPPGKERHRLPFDLYVQDISTFTTHDRLYGLFQRYAKVTHLFLGRSNRHSNSQYAWVSFPSAQEAADAFAALQGTYESRRILHMEYRDKHQELRLHQNVPRRFDVLLDTKDKSLRALDIHRFIERKWDYRVEDVVTLGDGSMYVQFARPSDAKKFLGQKTFFYNGRETAIEIATNSDTLR